MKENKKNGLGILGVAFGLAAAGCGIASAVSNRKQKETHDPDEVRLHDWYPDEEDDEEE